ncbi:hypothetical protein J3R30DRAFT_3700731 [Lentinula aciculospora]|uniref:Complex 1 LYR protein domain-containing protein n=1 Tax=Lentinula aciculospora TaxID=153920 RepID=A0A9W9AEU1_9AGAR|nr:hypothetical protein J3R30DRAFT_3700731 [Lentinula aciculospora]
MSNPPSRRAILSLYHSTLRTSKSFSSYNFRNYFIRRAKDTFRAIKSESDPARIQNLYSEATRELAVLRRSAIVNQLYGGWKLAIEDQKTEMTRADT